MNFCFIYFFKILVKTPREGVLDLVTLKTISSFARIQTASIDKKTNTEDAFKLMRQCVWFMSVKKQRFFVFFQGKNCKK